MLPAQKPPKPFRVPAPPVDPADLPPGVDHDLANEVLSYYLTGGEDTPVNDIGSECNIAARTVIEILESPFAVRILAAMRRLAHQRADILAAEFRTQALYVTRRIATSHQSDEIARRAANALLNFRTYTHTPPAPAAASPSDPKPTPPKPRRDPQDGDHTRLSEVILRVPRPASPVPSPAARVPPFEAQPRIVAAYPAAAPIAQSPTVPSAAPQSRSEAAPSHPTSPRASAPPHHPLTALTPSPPQASSRPHLTYTPHPPARADPSPPKPAA